MGRVVTVRPRWSAAVLASVLVLGACGDDDESAVTTSPPGTTASSPTATTPASSSATSSTTTVTSAPGTAPATTDAAAPGSTAGGECRDTPFDSTDPVSVDFPQRMSGLVGADIRTGAHPCFERVVLELEGTGDLPGYRVQYVDDPVLLSPSDLTVEIAGDATLLLQAGVWMTNMEGEGYDGPTDIVPTNVDHLLELRMTENFEGMTSWAIGLDRARPFVVDTLTDPPRIVVDVWTADDAG